MRISTFVSDLTIDDVVDDVMKGRIKRVSMLEQAHVEAYYLIRNQTIRDSSSSQAGTAFVFSFLFSFFLKKIRKSCRYR